jgi:hypothetical protein
MLINMLQMTEKAPFGRGLADMVDETVCKMSQIDASRVSFHHPRWTALLQELTTKVAEDLGCLEPSNVTASLHKLVLGDLGGFFKAHKDTEKEEPGMFATMVRIVPSSVPCSWDLGEKLGCF